MKERKKMMLKGMMATALAALVGTAVAQDVTLVENGVAKCRVVLPEKPSATETFLAKEIVKYAEVSTGAKVEIEGQESRSRSREDGNIPLVLKTDAGLKPESFVIETKPDGMTITGGDDLGLLYPKRSS